MTNVNGKDEGASARSRYVTYGILVLLALAGSYALRTYTVGYPKHQTYDSLKHSSEKGKSPYATEANSELTSYDKKCLRYYNLELHRLFNRADNQTVDELRRALMSQRSYDICLRHFIRDNGELRNNAREISEAIAFESDLFARVRNFWHRVAGARHTIKVQHNKASSSDAYSRRQNKSYSSRKSSSSSKSTSSSSVKRTNKRKNQYSFD